MFSLFSFCLSVKKKNIFKFLVSKTFSFIRWTFRLICVQNIISFAKEWHDRFIKWTLVRQFHCFMLVWTHYKYKNIHVALRIFDDFEAREKKSLQFVKSIKIEVTLEQNF